MNRGLVLSCLLLALALAFCSFPKAYGHSWYDPACCSGEDCHPVDDSELEELANGDWKHLPTGLVFSKKKVKPSEDKHQHICIWKGHPMCIYIRQSS